MSCPNVALESKRNLRRLPLPGCEMAVSLIHYRHKRTELNVIDSVTICSEYEHDDGGV